MPDHLELVRASGEYSGCVGESNWVIPSVSPLRGGLPLGFTVGCCGGGGVLAVLLPPAPPPPLVEGLLPELHRPINTQNSCAEPANNAQRIGSPPQKFVCHISPSLNGSKPSESIAFSGLLFTYAYRLRELKIRLIRYPCFLHQVFLNEVLSLLKRSAHRDPR